MRIATVRRNGALLAGAALCFAMIGAPAATAQDAVQAGVSAAVRGDVQLARADAVGRQVTSGDSIFLQDAITSGSQSGMQILLLDETVFTIGPESELTIDEFVYDPASGQGSLVADMAKGTMRFVTGNIAAGTPENMQIKLPVGTIGIRGTNGVVSVLTPDQAQSQFPQQAPQLGGGGGPNGPVVFAALVGPGPLNQTGGAGSFNFSTPDGSVDLNRPGGAVLATPGAPPVFFIAPPGAIQNVTNSLRSNQGSSGTEDGIGESGDSGSQPAGNSGGGDSSTNQKSGAGTDTSLNTVDNLATDTQTGQDTDVLVSDIANSTSSSQTTFGDIAGNFAGKSSASGSGSLSGSGGGSFQVFLSFSDRTVDVQVFNFDGFTGTAVELNSGNGVSVSDSATGVAINSSNNTGNCISCTGQLNFTGLDSVELTVQHNSTTGTGSTTLSP